MSVASRYSIELVNQAGLLLAELSGRARNRQIVMSRNEAEEISWTLDLDEFEAYCRALRRDPRTILISGSTEVLVKRLGTYLCGAQLVYKNPRITAQGGTIELRATGFLNLFAKRRTGTSPAGTVQENFTGVTRGDLLWALISQSQALTNGNYGVTRGPKQYLHGSYDKTYSSTNIKEALQAQTQLQTDPLDFEFTFDKQFNTYQQLGSARPDIIFEYPGNIIDIAAPEDATNIINEVTGVGAGNGSDVQPLEYASDLISQSDVRLRQDTVMSNATDNSDGGLTDAVEAELAAWSKPFEVPAITVNGNRAPFVTDYRVGDWVQIKINNHPLLAHINGTYRIEKMTINIDDNDKEEVVLEVSQ